MRLLGKQRQPQSLSQASRQFTEPHLIGAAKRLLVNGGGSIPVILASWSRVIKDHPHKVFSEKSSFSHLRCETAVSLQGPCLPRAQLPGCFG